MNETPLSDEVAEVFSRLLSQQLSDGADAHKQDEETRAEQRDDEAQLAESMQARREAQERAEHAELIANLELVAGKCALEEQLFAKQRLLNDYARDLTAEKKAADGLRVTLGQKDEIIRTLQQQNTKQHAENEHLNALMEKSMLTNAHAQPVQGRAKQQEELGFFKRALAKHKATLARQEQTIAALQEQLEGSHKRSKPGQHKKRTAAYSRDHS
jgi:hypothetical protein